MNYSFGDLLASFMFGCMLGLLALSMVVSDRELPTEWKDGGLIKHDKAVYRLVEVK